MAKAPLASLSGALFSGDQRDALDAIGAALKYRRISFDTAAELGNLVKRGESEEALERLTQAKT